MAQARLIQRPAWPRPVWSRGPLDPDPRHPDPLDPEARSIQTRLIQCPLDPGPLVFVDFIYGFYMWALYGLYIKVSIYRFMDSIIIRRLVGA